MLGITDDGSFCAAILLFLALPGPGALEPRHRARRIAGVILVAFGIKLGTQ